MITVKVNDKKVLEVLNQLTARVRNVRPAFKEIGEDLVDTTKRRFTIATAPDGTPWAPNSPVTVDRYLGQFSNTRKKDGSLSKAGKARSSTKKPLTGETKALQTGINYQLQGAAAVAVGSPQPYAAIQQLGGTKAQFPHLWGDIPARPYLGVSTADRQNIVEIIGSYLVP